MIVLWILVRLRNPLPLAVVMERWLCRRKGVRLMRNGKVQEAVTCDLLLQIPHSVGAEVSLPNIEGSDKGRVATGYKGDERVVRL